MFEQITALHQQVRDYVEQMEPEYKVAEIEGESQTRYARTLDTMAEIHPNYVKYILRETTLRFRVRAVHVAAPRNQLTCDVQVRSDGQLVLVERRRSC